MTNKIWAIVPAAGKGARMDSDLPKQYLPLAGKTVIEHSLHTLHANTQIEKIIVAINPNDNHWKQLSTQYEKKVISIEGGDERFYSVYKALQHLKNLAQDNDWVLVHDAARPCLLKQDLHHLMSSLINHPVGGLLMAPVVDTIKRTNLQGSITETVDRSDLYRALTPQMFRYKLLFQAFTFCLEQTPLPTDEAMAIEHYGLLPQGVLGDACNIKITLPTDLATATNFLLAQPHR